MSKHKILLADDNPSVLKLLEIILKKQGHEIIVAENGEKAFELANREKPDLIISDMMMPQMDGLEFCWMIRENSEIPTVPFIFLTSFKDDETEVRGFRAGADKFLTKPIERADLLAAVEQLLSRHDRLVQASGADAISGDLKDLSIVEVVQMMNLNKKSGILHIHGNLEGDIYLKDGHLFAATCEDKTGEDAVYELVARATGQFNFEIAEVGVERNVNLSTMNVIMEACRIMDEKNANES